MAFLLPSEFIHQDGVIKLYDSVLDGIQINVNDANVVTALGNPSSTFHKKYKTAVEEGVRICRFFIF